MTRELETREGLVMSVLARKCILTLTSYKGGKQAEEVQARFGLSDIVKLGSNENPLGTSHAAVEAMTASVKNASIYPDSSSSALVKALSALYNLPENHFLPGNGSNEIFLLTAGAFLNPGNTSLISENTFSQYACATRIFDGRSIRVPLKDFRNDLQAFLDHMGPEVKLAFLCNPNNPTGTYSNSKEIEKFLKLVPSSCIIVLDEAYAEFADAPDFPNCVELVSRFPNLLVCRTFSKIYGLSGVRLGYAMANPELIEMLNRVRNYNPYNINRVAQAGAVAALRDSAFISHCRKTNLEGRAFLSSELGKLNIQCLPSQANFICFRASIPGKLLSELLLKKGVIIRPLDSFGMAEWCRVTIGTPQQNGTFLKSLKECLQQADI